MRKSTFTAFAAAATGLAMFGLAAPPALAQARTVQLANDTAGDISINWLNGSTEQLIATLPPGGLTDMNTTQGHAFIVRDRRNQEIDRFQIGGATKISIDGFRSNASGKIMTLGSGRASVEDVLGGLRYDWRRLLVTEEDGAQSVIPDETRVGNAVILCEAHPVRGADARATFDRLTVFSPSGAVHAGQAVWADQKLAEGAPAPIGLQLAPVKLTLDLEGSTGLSRVVEAPNVATLNAARIELLNEYFNSKRLGAPARYKLSYEEVDSSQEISARLGFKASWAENSGSLSTKVDSKSNSSTVFGIFTQVFYSVDTDTPNRGAFFAPSVTPAALAAEIERRDAPPAYVNRVDYGRIIVVKMTTSGVFTSGEVKAAFKAVDPESGGSAEGSLNAKAKEALNSATFDVFQYGGAADDGLLTLKKASEVRQKIGKIIGNNLKFDKASAGVPIAYHVRFLDSNDVAKIGVATEFVEHECKQIDDRWLTLFMDGWYVLKNWKVTYEDKGKTHTALDQNSVPINVKRQVQIPATAGNVRVHAVGALVGNPDIINQTVNTNQCIRFKGTVFDYGWESKGSC